MSCWILCSSVLVSARLAASTSTFELPAFGANKWLRVTARNTRRRAKMLLGLSSLSWSLQKQRVLTLRSTKSQLVESNRFSASLDNPCACGRSEAQSANGHRRNFVDALVIRDCSNTDDNLLFVPWLFEVSNDASDGERRSVAFRHVKSLEHDFIEPLAGIQTLGKIAVELHQYTQIRIFTFRRFAAHFPIILMVDVNSHIVLDFQIGRAHV